jgi:hypothetical protein
MFAAILLATSPVAYPGPEYLAPVIHHSPDCLHIAGWHDIAGSISHKDPSGKLLHHVFQGCPGSGGWSHAMSSDFVFWLDLGVDVVKRNETAFGMLSTKPPCSGFVSVGDDGRVCAGFRQCGSDHGATELNPAANAWDVPLEYRCATDTALTKFGDDEYLYPVYYYRPLPYDPVRPWRDTDGKWYSALSTDGCNATTRRLPCAAGGRLDLWRADNFSGPWTQLAPMFTTNTTMSGGVAQVGAITKEFVTSGYIGGLPGDPDGGSTRVITQNNAGATFWVGRQANGGPFSPYWDKPGAVGHYDYGSMTMARTLGSSDANQVAVNGRRVLVGWLGGPNVASQSLPRDLSLSSSYELLQAFVPELMLLRKPGSHTSRPSAALPESLPPSSIATRSGARDPISSASMQLEILASFSFDATAPPQAPFGVEAYCVGDACVRLQIDCSTAAAAVSCTVGVNTTAMPDTHHGQMATAPLLPLLPSSGSVEVTVHAILDHTIIEAIFNNRSAITGMYAKPPTADAYTTRAFGGVTGKVDWWELDSPGVRRARAASE